MANDKDVKRAWLGVDLGGTKILAGVFDDGLSRLARSKTDAKASGGVEEVIGRIVKHLLGIFVDTGIGGGLILNGELFIGFNGAAGKFGQMTLDCGGGVGPDNVPGSLESIASRSALTRQIEREVKNGRSTLLTEIVGPDLKEIKSGHLRKAIERGDTFVESLVCRAAKHVGAAIGTLINIINPEVIVLGGGLMEQLEKRILPIIRAKALEYSDSGVNRGIRIVASSLADDAGIVGAAAFARRSSKG